MSSLSIKPSSSPSSLVGGEIVDFILIGSGTSEGIPRVSCVLRGDCATCVDAHLALKGISSKNYRGNVCGIIRYLPAGETKTKNIMLDCGKLWWNTAMRIFPQYGIDHIDAIVISHSHNDAAYGLDDLRDFTRNIKNHPPIHIYLREVDAVDLKGAFPYLFDTRSASAGGGVSSLQFHELTSNSPFDIFGLTFTPLPLHHGATGCNGYRFGNISWLSDAVAIDAPVMSLVENSSLVFIDALREDMSEKHASHFTIEQAMNCILSLKQRPRHVVFVGMAHEIEHYTTNQILIQHDLASLSKSDIDALFHVDGVLKEGPYPAESCQRSDHAIVALKPEQNINNSFEIAMELGYDGQRFDVKSHQ